MRTSSPRTINIELILLTRACILSIWPARALVAKYYNQAPKFAYYSNCSEVGREGMMEAQRFPEDFNGVVAGCAPLNKTINTGLYLAWNILANNGSDGNSIITTDKLPILHKAVVAQCDAADGLKDGLISDPLACHPDLAAVECKPGQDPATCLTREQVRAAQEIYKGAYDAQGGKLTPGGSLPGAELSWTAFVANSATPTMSFERLKTGTTLIMKSLFLDPPPPDTFTLSDLKFDRATFEATTRLRYLYDATNPDLTSFAKAGRKLIMWHGLGDAYVEPSNSILYYAALQKVMGAKAVGQFARLYLLPGVHHCGGGEGPLVRDFLTPLMLWVERGVAPGALIAAHIPGNPRGMRPSEDAPAAPTAPDRTRPVYPYPYTPQYTGKGSIDDASNFVQGPARPAPAEMFDWYGAGFYKPGFQKWRTATGAVFQCKDTH